MSISFNGQWGLIVIPVRVTGASGVAVVRLALDTGATRTLINASLLVAVGYDPAATLERTDSRNFPCWPTLSHRAPAWTAFLGSISFAAKFVGSISRMVA